MSPTTGYRFAVNDAVHDVNLFKVASFGDGFAFAVLIARSHEPAAPVKQTAKFSAVLAGAGRSWGSHALRRPPEQAGMGLHQLDPPILHAVHHHDTQREHCR